MSEQMNVEDFAFNTSVRFSRLGPENVASLYFC